MSSLIVVTQLNGVATLRMNLPKRLNGWTFAMMQALKQALAEAATDAETQVVVLTGTDPYYSAGVNLGSTLRFQHPRKLHAQIVEHNQSLFESFLNFPKPLLAAVNGPAIGAVVTSATLCDVLLASDQATFSTPFARLGVPPEGCSSVLFARLMGQASAERMLGEEGWTPTGEEAAAVGLATSVVEHGALLSEAQRIAESWIAEGRVRQFRGDTPLSELLEVNARESVAVADAFLGPRFLEGQYRFLRKKGKRRMAAMFYLLWRTHPVWSYAL